MKRCNVFAALVFVLLTACATTGGPTAPVPGPGPGEGDPSIPASTKFSACTTDATKNQAATLLDDFASAFASQDYEGAIKDKLAGYAADVVKCGVQFFVDAITHKANHDELAAMQLARAQAWLAKH